jgi:hypothetical protein
MPAAGERQGLRYVRWEIASEKKAATFDHRV